MSTAKIVELDETNTCKLCDNALGKYSCPRCNILYCSLTCYRSEKHAQCSETFYKDCVTQELALDEQDEDAQRKMLEMLARNCFDDRETIDSDDEGDVLDLGDRLAGIDLNHADKVWEKLTNDEKQEFMAFLKSEDVAKFVPKWAPWWEFVATKKVQEVEDAGKYKEKCPEVVSGIKDFNAISSKPPADCVTYNLINILTAYVFTAKYFNGDYFDFAKESASCVITLSLCLKNNENFPDFETAVKSVEQEIINSQWILADSENLNAMREDLNKIIKGPEKTDRKFYIFAALSDLKRLFKAACKKEQQTNTQSEFSKQFPESEVAVVEKEKIKHCTRKLDYYLSFTKDYLKL